MNKQDKLFKRIKQAAEKQEQQAFSRKEEVWETVSQKLNPKKRKRMILYRTLGAAAVIAVLIFAGFQFTDFSNPLNENPIINKNIQLNDTPNTEIVQDVKEELKEAEKLDIQYLDSVEKEVGTPKPIKIKPIVATEADLEAIEDTAEIEDKKALSRKAEQQDAVSSSVESISAKTNDSNLNLQSKTVVSEKKQLHEAYLQKQAQKTQQNFVTDIENQNKFMINGTVMDEDGLPIPGVNIFIKGTSSGTQTDFDGQFSIEVETGQTLTFSYVGMFSQEVEIKKQKSLNITLEYSVEALNEVVVVNNSKRKHRRKETESAKKIEALAGVQYDAETVSSYAISSPNPQESKTIKIRGNTSALRQPPLYIIDGKTATKDELKSLNPNDIKSVNVIKAKSELFMRGYGEKSKNGIIEISTKNENDSDIKPDSIVYWYNQHIRYYHNTEEYKAFKENPFTSPLSEPLSTFSIDVDRAAYTNIRRFINNGQDVPKDAVRIEEMLNFFEYDYNKPTDQQPFAIHTAYTDAPWNDKHKLLKIALQGKNIPVEKLPASNLVFLIDVSGSMSNQNKLPLVKKSLNLLVDQMRAKDKIALVTYASNSRVALEPTSGNQKTKIKNAIDQLSAGGSTHGSQGIETAYSLAEEHFVKEGNNRVIIATDGDFNMGVTTNESLEDLIAKKRESNIYLTCLGYGMGNYKDSKMQSLSQKGNGNYAYIDTYQEAQKFLEREFKGSLYAIAKDVKIQIEFNPKHVDSYRLIGYETRMLEDRDFADDTKDAGEIGVNHQVTALYEVIPRGVESQYGEFTPDLKYQKVEKPSFEGYSDELATVKFRYKPTSSDKSIKLERVIKNQSVKLSQASADFKFATAVAWFGLKLRDSQLISNVDKDAIIELAKQGLDNDREGYRAEFIRLVRLYE